MFRDRIDGGNQLAELLIKYRNDPDAIVIGLPRGGVVTAFAVAKKLGLPLDIVCPRKIGAPFNPEYAIGAICETGEGEFDQNAIDALGVTNEYIKSMVEKEKEVAQNRLKLYRGRQAPRNLKNRTVIIVDDGLATGSTMKAAIHTVKKENPAKIVVAVPVSPQDTYNDIQGIVDEIVTVNLPSGFYAVGQFYGIFNQTSDQEVIEIMSEYS